jgi:circadian clock protein KaiC
MHLSTLGKLIRQYKPKVVVVDPITNLITAGNPSEVNAMLGRLMDMFKSKGITAMFTSLTQGGGALEQTEYGVSSFVDTWILLRDYEDNGERNRLIYVLKSRGTGHSNQVREFIINNDGISLVPVYMGDEGIRTGSGRVAAEARVVAEAGAHTEAMAQKVRRLEHERMITEAHLKSSQAELAIQDAELKDLLSNESSRVDSAVIDRAALASSRSGIKRTTLSQEVHRGK